MRFMKCAGCNHKYCEFCYTGEKFQSNKNTTEHHYKYKVNNEYTGEVILMGEHSEEDIKLAIIDDLYSVEYKEIYT